MSTLAMFAFAEAAEETRELPLPAWSYGAISLGLLLLLLLITWFFRNAGHTLVYGPGGVRQGADPHASPDHSARH